MVPGGSQGSPDSLTIKGPILGGLEDVAGFLCRYRGFPGLLHVGEDSIPPAVVQVAYIVVEEVRSFGDEGGGLGEGFNHHLAHRGEISGPGFGL